VAGIPPKRAPDRPVFSPFVCVGVNFNIFIFSNIAFNINFKVCCFILLLPLSLISFWISGQRVSILQCELSLRGRPLSAFCALSGMDFFALSFL
jgi:hypothetical protein